VRAHTVIDPTAIVSPTQSAPMERHMADMLGIVNTDVTQQAWIRNENVNFFAVAVEKLAKSP
jgi:hypothetical protein